MRIIQKNALFVACSLTFLSGCSTSQVKRFDVDVRVPRVRAVRAPVRLRLVLAGANDLPGPNLSKSSEYILRARGPLTRVLLSAASARMRAHRIEPLEGREAQASSGRLIVALVRLEVQLKNNFWFASALIRAERYTRSGRPLGQWESKGRGSYQDSRIRAGAAGLALGRAIGQALDRLPWRAIAAGRPPRRR